MGVTVTGVLSTRGLLFCTFHDIRGMEQPPCEFTVHRLCFHHHSAAHGFAAWDIWLTMEHAPPPAVLTGYDHYGYDKYGYSKDGYDKDGYDKYGEF